MSLDPFTADDPARVADFGTLPGDFEWAAKKLSAYERRIEQLEERLFVETRTAILACISGESEGVVLVLCEGLRSVSRSELLDILIEEMTVEEGLSLWCAPSDKADKAKKRIIDSLAWDATKARAETEAHIG